MRLLQQRACALRVEDIVAVEQEKIFVDLAASRPERDQVVRNGVEGVVEQLNMADIGCLYDGAHALYAKTANDDELLNADLSQVL